MNRDATGVSFTPRSLFNQSYNITEAVLRFASRENWFDRVSAHLNSREGHDDLHRSLAPSSWCYADINVTLTPSIPSNLIDDSSYLTRPRSPVGNVHIFPLLED